MPYTIDETTQDIELPLGETISFRVRDKSGVYQAVVYAIYDSNQGEDLLRVPADFVDGEAIIRLATSHTRDLPTGLFKYNFRLVSDPEYDEDGNIVAKDTSDNVVTVYGPKKNDIPNIRLVMTGGRV